MKKILTLTFIIFSFTLHSQDFELRKTPFIKSKIVLKDGTIKNGFTKLNSSAFDIRFKEKEDLKSIKVDYKKVDSLITNPGKTNHRVFRYLKNYDDKRLKFVELIYTDVINIYIGSKDELSIFYSEFDRSTAREIMNEMRYDFYSRRNLPYVYTVNLPNGNTIDLPIRYDYLFESDFVFTNALVIPIKYYLVKNSIPILIPVKSKRRFLKKHLQYFDDCQKFVEDYEQGKIDLENLPSFIEYYKLLRENDECNQ